MILDDIIAYKKSQIEKEKKRISHESFSNCNNSFREFKKALRKDRITIVAEIKKASPSKGIIKKDFNPAEIAKIYEKIDVDAISVLTEKYFFKGDDEYILEVKNVSSKPVLRKDFIVDEYQIYQSKALGADAILLIASVLKDKIKSFYAKAKEIGLDCIAEVHDERDLEFVLSAGCDVIGINNRNLKDFTVDLKTTERLIRHIPYNVLVISESGIKNTEDIKYLKSLGVDSVLIGETFMRKIENVTELKDFVLNVRKEGHYAYGKG